MGKLDPDVAKRPRCQCCGKPLRPSVISKSVRVQRPNAWGGLDTFHEEGPPSEFLGYGYFGVFCAQKCAVDYALNKVAHLKAKVPAAQQLREIERARLRFEQAKARELRKAKAAKLREQAEREGLLPDRVEEFEGG
jgi:hypothetical protein